MLVRWTQSFLDNWCYDKKLKTDVEALIKNAKHSILDNSEELGILQKAKANVISCSLVSCLLSTDWKAGGGGGVDVASASKIKL